MDLSGKGGYPVTATGRTQHLEALGGKPTRGGCPDATARTGYDGHRSRCLSHAPSIHACGSTRHGGT